MGAPVMAFCRIDVREIRLREPVMAPDALIIQTRRCCTRSITSTACPSQGSSCSIRRAPF
jgi:hypothetical protein